MAGPWTGHAWEQRSELLSMKYDGDEASSRRGREGSGLRAVLECNPVISGRREKIQTRAEAMKKRRCAFSEVDRD